MVGPFSLWWYSVLGAGSQQSFTLAIIRSMSVLCQKACTSGEALIFRASLLDSHLLLQTTSPTHCSTWEKATNQCGSPTPPSACSSVINWPMLRAEGAGGHTPSPCTLTFHCHAATRCLARDLAVPSAPDVSVVSNLCHGTSSSVLPQAATCNHCCALQCGLISSKVSGSSSPMSTWANSHQARLPLEASICSVAGSPCLPPSH